MVRKKSNNHSSWYCCNAENCGGSKFWGWMLVTFGGWFLAKELGLISQNFSIWPIILIFIGLHILKKK